MSAAPQFPPGYSPEEERLPEQPPAPPQRPLWQRILLWTGVVILILIVVVVVGVYALLHSRSFHNYMLRTAQQKATAALGSTVHIQEFALNFSGISPTLDVYGVVVDGAAPYTRPPLLQVQHARVGVRILSLLHKKWYLSDVTVSHPVVQAFVDKDGRSNIPSPKSSDGKSNTNVFDLAIRHALLDKGEIYYNNRKSILDADLHNLDLQAYYNVSPQSYAGSLGYSDGHLRMATYNTINHEFHAEFVASPTEFTLQNATLRSGPSQFVLNAKLTNYANPRIHATYSAVLNGGEFRRVLKNPSIPVGVLSMSGRLSYVVEPNTPFLKGVTLNGRLSSRELLVRTPRFNGPIRNVSANYSLDKGNFYVRDLSAQLLGGRLSADLITRDISGAQQSQLKASLQNVSAGALRSVANSPSLKNVEVAGSANAALTASFGKNLSDLEANADIALNSTVTPHRRALSNVTGNQDTKLAPATNIAANQSIPVTGQIHAHYSGKTKQLTLSNSYIRMSQTTLSFDGSLNSRRGIAINLNHVDLHELASVASLFSTSSKPALPPGLSGLANFNGTVRGTTSAPRLMGLVVINNLDVNGSGWRWLRANVDISPSNATLNNGVLVSSASGRATFDVNVGLHRWSFTKRSPFKIALNVQQLNLASLTKAAQVQTPVTGILSASVNAHGTQAAPAGTVQLGIAHAELAGQPAQSIQAKLNSDGALVRANLGVKLPAGTATANATYDLARENYQAALKATGIQLAQLQVVKSKGMGLNGTLDINASGSGNIHNPQFAATVQIPKLVVQNQSINNITLQARVANHVANTTLNAAAVDSSLRAQARVNLTGDYEAAATIDTQPIPLAPFIAAYAPAQAGNISGQTELHGTIRGPLKDKQRLEAHFTIPTLILNYKNTVQIGAPQPILFDYVNGVLDIQRSTLKGTDTDLQFQGRIPLTDNSAPSSLLLLGSVDLRLAQIVNPDVTTSGQLRFDINSFGQLANPNVQGRIRIVNAGFTSGDVPLGLSDGNGVLTLTRDRLDITQFTGKVGGGNVTMKGAVLYRPNIQFDMAMRGRGIRFLYPDGVRSGLGMNLTLTGTTDDATLGGQVNLSQLSFTPDFDLASIMGQFGGSTEPPPSQGFSNNLKLNLVVRSIQGINLVSRQLSIDGTLNLEVKGTAAEPVVLGRINLNGGDFLFNNKRFVLQGGTVDFVNPTVTQPVLNIAVNTDVQQYKVAMRFEGPVDHLRTSYNSDPALPPADIIHLIAFGSTTESAAANPSPPGNLAAEQKIASAVSGQVTSRVAKIAGLSQLSIDPTLGGAGTQSSPGANITIQQRITSKIFVTFSTDVTSTQNQVIQLEYRPSRRFSFSGTRDQNGGVAFDTRIHKTW